MTARELGLLMMAAKMLNGADLVAVRGGLPQDIQLLQDQKSISIVTEGCRFAVHPQRTRTVRSETDVLKHLGTDTAIVGSVLTHGTAERTTCVRL